MIDVKVERGSRISGRWAGPRWLALATAAVAFLGLVAPACAPGTPQAVLNVPGTYVADLWHPPAGFTNGGTGATVLVCLDEAVAVQIRTGEGGEGWIGSIDLDWYGTRYHADSGGSVTSLTTPVLPPGCGTLRFDVDCCHVDHYLAVEVAKV